MNLYEIKRKLQGNRETLVQFHSQLCKSIIWHKGYDNCNNKKSTHNKTKRLLFYKVMSLLLLYTQLYIYIHIYIHSIIINLTEDETWRGDKWWRNHNFMIRGNVLDFHSFVIIKHTQKWKAKTQWYVNDSCYRFRWTNN